MSGGSGLSGSNPDPLTFFLLYRHPGRRPEHGDGFPIEGLVLSINKAHVPRIRRESWKTIRIRESEGILRHPPDDNDDDQDGRGVGETKAPRHLGDGSAAGALVALTV